MKKIIVGLGNCTGCRCCQIICALSREGELNYELARIQILKDDKLGLSVALPCSQCEKAPCVEVCPTDAIAFDPKTGANEIDLDKCIVCKMCVTACPTGSISIIEKKGKEKVIKCNLCEGNPQCVTVCEPGAIRYEEPIALAKGKSDAFAHKLFDIIKEHKGLG
jgi:carbon-monoxide dehydrogenase iron sulfur subunit